MENSIIFIVMMLIGLTTTLAAFYLGCLPKPVAVHLICLRVEGVYCNLRHAVYVLVKSRC